MRLLHWRGLGGCAAVGGLVTTLVVGVPAAPAGAARLPVLVAGAVQSDGRPVAGARILLYEWPDSSVLSRLRPGQAVPWRLVARSTTDSAGAYALGVDPAMLVPLAAPDGIANLEVLALSAEGQAEYSFPRPRTAAGEAAQTATLANLQLRPVRRVRGTRSRAAGRAVTTSSARRSGRTGTSSGRPTA
jgi:hypothetical protein